jgi:uncharacterized protein (DUF342 family)
MRKQMIEALKAHAQAHINKHKMNVEVFLNNPVGVGEHPAIMDSIEAEIEEIAKYEDQLEVLNKHFTDIKL